MACICSLCTGGPKPDGCKCPGDKHVDMKCFVTQPKQDLAKVTAEMNEFVLQSLAGEDLFKRWKSGELQAADVVGMIRRRIEDSRIPSWAEATYNPWG